MPDGCFDHLPMSLPTEQARLAPIVVIEEPGRQPLLVAVVQTLEVGRECSGIVLTDPAISRRHLVVVPHGHTVRVTDLGTTNGSTVGGCALEPNHLLRVGDAVKFGACTLGVIGAPGPVAGGTSTRDTRATSGADAAIHSLRATSIDIVADAVMNESLRPPVEKDVGTVTVVFSDIEGSTTRAVELGDSAWMQVLDTHNTIVRRMVARHRGTEVKAQGDGFMLSFRSAHGAIACMVDVQRALAAHGTAQPLQAVRVRAGMHTGEVIHDEDGDIFGRHVIMAARLSAHAQGGEVLVSSLVREIVEPRGDVHFGTSRTVDLKGLGGTHLVHPVSW
jgi:class 3 adenylate cyclase